MSNDENPKPTIRGRIKKAFVSAAKAVREVAQLDFFSRFKSDEREIDFPIDMGRDTVWATQAQMASLFGVDRSAISKHVKKIFDDKELDESDATYAKFAQVQTEGGREVSREVPHYSLDVILAVGYRVSGTKYARPRRTCIFRSGTPSLRAPSTTTLTRPRRANSSPEVRTCFTTLFLSKRLLRSFWSEPTAANPTWA